MDDTLNFVPIKCPNCNGYGKFGREPNRQVCPSCQGSGVLIVDQMTGKVIISNDDENKDNLD